jgi:hypothetical protein
MCNISCLAAGFPLVIEPAQSREQVFLASFIHWRMLLSCIAFPSIY